MRLQLTPRRSRRRAAVAAASGFMLAAVVAPAHGAALLDEDPAAEVTMQMFTDSDEVSVRSQIGHAAVRLPRAASMSLQFNHETVKIPGISAPVGSEEAVDAITTASRPISGDAYDDFTKVRNEVTLGAGTRSTTVGYYLSEEVDYRGQQVSAGWNRDLADDLMNVAVGASYGWDDIRPVSDDDTNTAAGTKTTLHWDVVGTRVLSPTTVLRAGLELSAVSGLQHNPYRNVYAGGTNVPENHPEERQRRNVFLRVNHAMPNRASLRLGYRYYGDDWGIDSHELGARLNQYVARSLYATYEYRYYTQGAADFYRPEYTTTAGVEGYLTGDYRLAALSSSLFGLALNLDGAAMDTSSELLQRMGLTVRWERYFNSNNYSANFLTTRLGYSF